MPCSLALVMYKPIIPTREVIPVALPATAGEVVPVKDTPFDFNSSPHTIGERINQIPGGHGYDHNYVLFRLGPQARFIVRNQAVSSMYVPCVLVQLLQGICACSRAAPYCSSMSDSR